MVSWCIESLHGWCEQLVKGIACHRLSPVTGSGRACYFCPRTVFRETSVSD